jgi:polysaccharide export outer membrane protein
MNRPTFRGANFASVVLPWIFAVATAAAGADGVLPPIEAGRYEIQPGDIIDISVWKEEDLRRTVLVRSDGGLSFPLAGDIVVAGFTPAQLQHEIQQRLGKYIPDATVSVAIQQVSGNQVFVVGKVNRPGVYRLERPLDVMQVLSLAGGTTEFAGVNDIRILRRFPDGTQQALSFEYAQVARGNRLEENILLKSGDTVVVP